MGFVTIPDNLPGWAWYHDNNTLLVYMRLYFAAVWCDTEYEHITLKRGQVITTFPKIAEENGITVRQARTILDRLKSTGKVTVKTTAKFSIITVLDYDCAHENVSQNDSQLTGERQADDSPSLLNTNIQTIKQPNNARAREGGGVDRPDHESSFKRFWAAYPKKTAKRQALKAWQKLWRELKPDKALIDIILSSLEQQKQSVQWTKDDGQFIPYPATWLNGRRWEDKPPEPLPKPGNNGTCYGHESSFDVDEIMQQVIESYQHPRTDKESV